MIEIIFFTWVALTIGNGFEVTDDVLNFYKAKCDLEGGKIGIWRSGVRKYAFSRDGKKLVRTYSGYDIICSRMEDSE